MLLGNDWFFIRCTTCSLYILLHEYYVTHCAVLHKYLIESRYGHVRAAAMRYVEAHS